MAAIVRLKRVEGAEVLRALARRLLGLLAVPQGTA